MTENALLLDSALNVSSFGENEDDETYVRTLDGGVYRITG